MESAPYSLRFAGGFGHAGNPCRCATYSFQRGGNVTAWTQDLGSGEGNDQPDQRPAAPPTRCSAAAPRRARTEAARPVRETAQGARLPGQRDHGRNRQDRRDVPGGERSGRRTPAAPHVEQDRLGVADHGGHPTENPAQTPGRVRRLSVPGARPALRISTAHHEEHRRRDPAQHLQRIAIDRQHPGQPQDRAEAARADRPAPRPPPAARPPPTRPTAPARSAPPRPARAPPTARPWPAHKASCRSRVTVTAGSGCHHRPAARTGSSPPPRHGRRGRPNSRNSRPRTPFRRLQRGCPGRQRRGKGGIHLGLGGEVLRQRHRAGAQRRAPGRP
jgi:hypothetical protein